MSLSKLNKEHISFVLPLSEEFNCPICLSILGEPYLTACCGNHFCESCVVSVKKNSGRCPICQATPLNGFVNKHFRRKLHELQVYCIHKEKGCQWKGDYGKIEKHLDFEKVVGECQFVMVKCPQSVHCQKMIRESVTNHVNKVCKYRQFSCKFCGFLSTYEVVTTLHNDECAKYPVPCPNHCSQSTYPRSELPNHINECPEEEIPCKFSEMGCKEKQKRRMLQQHLEDNVILHQMVMCKTFSEKVKLYASDKEALEKKLSAQDMIIKNLQKDKAELETKVDRLTEKIDTLKPKHDDWLESLKFMTSKVQVTNWPLYLSKMAEITAMEPVIPVIIKLQLSITKERFSSSEYHYISTPYTCMPFYSHAKGYKLQLSAKVVCHCSSCPQMYFNPSHSLSLSVELRVIHGEYDVHLQWPFLKSMLVTLLNEEADSNHQSQAQVFKSRLAGFEVSQGTVKQPEQPLYMQLVTQLSQYGIHLPEGLDAIRSHSESSDALIFPLNIKDQFVYSDSKYIGECQKGFYVKVIM